MGLSRNVDGGRFKNNAGASCCGIGSGWTRRSVMRRTAEILVVDDSPSDARLAREALLSGSTPKRISVVTDGAEALDFVYRRGTYATAPRPDLILLDLNLPKINGLEVLRRIKGDPQLRSITVIILTTSPHPKDVSAAYELLANCYIVKPLDLDRFYSVMHGIEEFWMSMASLPTDGSSPMFSNDEEVRGITLQEPKKDSTSAHARHRHDSPQTRSHSSRVPHERRRHGTGRRRSHGYC